MTHGLKLRFFLDESVPSAVGRALDACGHEVILLKDASAPGAPDTLVCTAAEANDAILVALDGDMRQLARRQGVGKRRYRRLSLLKLSCRETKAAERTAAAMSLIEHEWTYSARSADRRIFIEIGQASISTRR